MKIAIISDIHANRPALDRVLESLPEYDRLFCLGDIVGYGPHPNEVVEKVRELNPTAVIMGNHDQAVVTGDIADFTWHAAEAIKWTIQHIEHRNLAYLTKLPSSMKINIAGVEIALFHGSPRDPLREYILPGTSDATVKKLIQQGGGAVLLLGHTHMPMFYDFGDIALGNPGSVGQPRDGDPRASYAVLDISEERFSFDVNRVEYDIDAVANKIIKLGLPNFLAERLYIGA